VRGRAGSPSGVGPRALVRTLNRLWLAAAVAWLVAAIAAESPVLAKSRPRPNLIVSAGGVSATTSRIFGSFVLKNTGSARAGRSNASLSLRAGSKTRRLASYSIGPLRASASLTVDVSVSPPKGLAAGRYSISVCANSSGSIRESSSKDDCRRIGKLSVPQRPPPSTGGVPSSPVSFQPDTPVALQSARSTYWVDVPDAYDASNQTPSELLVWLHGCGGEGAGDIYTVSPPSDGRYIAIAVGGREDDCWDPNTDQDIVLAAISDVETHFNIDRHEVVLGGYSSGGDLAYRLAFYHSLLFSGVLAENTSPFRDTGSTASQSLAAAQWKFNVVHLAHTEDDVYPINGVVNELDTMQQAGFPVQLIERPGHHYDDSTATSGSDHDLQTYLLPHLNDGWRSP
jgi:pimeloyl-ACP methyl ester carboxylesterase